MYAYIVVHTPSPLPNVESRHIILNKFATWAVNTLAMNETLDFVGFSLPNPKLSPLEKVAKKLLLLIPNYKSQPYGTRMYDYIGVRKTSITQHRATTFILNHFATWAVNTLATSAILDLMGSE